MDISTPQGPPYVFTVRGPFGNFTYIMHFSFILWVIHLLLPLCLSSSLTFHVLYFVIPGTPSFLLFNFVIYVFISFRIFFTAILGFGGVVRKGATKPFLNIFLSTPRILRYVLHVLIMVGLLFSLKHFYRF